MPKTRTRLDLLGLVEGYYASELALGLMRSGALEVLAAGHNVEVVAQAVEMDAGLLRQMLDFLARASDLIECEGTHRFRLGDYSIAEIAFQLEKFIGAYGKSVRGLATSKVASSNGTEVDEVALAAAFGAASFGPSKITKRLREEGYRRLVDLGCGPASLLIELAAGDPGFSGVGLDRSAAMCRLARSRVRQAGVSSQVKIRQADVRDVGGVLDAPERRRVDVIHGRSVINAFFGRGLNAAEAVLRKLRRAFPKRVAYFVDYYGELGRAAEDRSVYRLGRAHDLAQLASGQGTPPPDCHKWRALYRAAGCKLISVDEMRTNDIRWFIHEVRLAL